MRHFIIVHDKTVELAFKYFHLDPFHRLGSFMGHPKCCPNILGYIQTIYMVKFFLVN
jgi:hypothetical protein